MLSTVCGCPSQALDRARRSLAGDAPAPVPAPTTADDAPGSGNRGGDAGCCPPQTSTGESPAAAASAHWGLWSPHSAPTSPAGGWGAAWELGSSAASGAPGGGGGGTIYGGGGCAAFPAPEPEAASPAAEAAERELIAMLSAAWGPEEEEEG